MAVRKSSKKSRKSIVKAGRKASRRKRYQRTKPEPCAEIDYGGYKHARPQAPDNPGYPEARFYGSYASKHPPAYVPHPVDHACFRPRPQDYKPVVRCEDDAEEAELCVRRDSRVLTEGQQSRFLNAFTQLNNLNALGPLVDIHANAAHQMHRNPRFLPWHRIYLLRMEELLQSVDPTVCIPYWRSSEQQAIPAWLADFTPTVSLMGTPHTVSRNPGAFATIPDAAAVSSATSNGTFGTFGAALEGIHDSVHVWVGGSMMSVPSAPADPMFWLHHCEIDRIWAEWQVANPGQTPSLAGAAATMDPWPETEADTRDIAELGYSYA